MGAESIVKWVILGAKVLPEIVPAIMKFKKAFDQVGDKSVSPDEFRKTIEKIESGHLDVVDAVDGVFSGEIGE